MLNHRKYFTLNKYGLESKLVCKNLKMNGFRHHTFLSTCTSFPNMLYFRLQTVFLTFCLTLDFATLMGKVEGLVNVFQLVISTMILEMIQRSWATPNPPHPPMILKRFGCFYCISSSTRDSQR